MSRIILACVFLVCVTSVRADCPKGWKGYQKNCYFMDPYRKNWESAKRYCSTLGAHLLRIDSEQETQFLKRTFTINRQYSIHDIQCYNHLVKRFNDSSRATRKKVLDSPVTIRYTRELLHFPDKTALISASGTPDVVLYSSGETTYYGAYIDGTDEQNEGHWKWSTTNDQIMYTKWRRPEPNGGRRENVINLLYDYTWNDGPKRFARPSICELDNKNVADSCTCSCSCTPKK